MGRGQEGVQLQACLTNYRYQLSLYTCDWHANGKYCYHRQSVAIGRIVPLPFTPQHHVSQKEAFSAALAVVERDARECLDDDQSALAKWQNSGRDGFGTVFIPSSRPTNGFVHHH